MRRATKLFLMAASLTAIAGAGTAYAVMLQTDTAAALRGSGRVGEQADGYLGIVGSADASLRAQVDAINIKRRAAYTDLAAKRGVKIEEAAASMACDIFSSAVQPGQYYRLPDGVWRKRDGNTPVPRPSYCG